MIAIDWRRDLQPDSLCWMAEDAKTGELEVVTGSAGGSMMITARLQELYHYPPLCHIGVAISAFCGHSLLRGGGGGGPWSSASPTANRSQGRS